MQGQISITNHLEDRNKHSNSAFKQVLEIDGVALLISLVLFVFAFLQNYSLIHLFCWVTQSPYIVDGLNTCISLRTSGVTFYLFRLLLRPADSWLHLSWNSQNIMNQTIGHAIESGKHNVRSISLCNRLKLSFICHGKTDHWHFVWLKFGRFLPQRVLWGRFGRSVKVTLTQFALYLVVLMFSCTFELVLCQFYKLRKIISLKIWFHIVLIRQTHSDEILKKIMLFSSDITIARQRRLSVVSDHGNKVRMYRVWYA